MFAANKHRLRRMAHRRSIVAVLVCVVGFVGVRVVLSPVAGITSSYAGPGEPVGASVSATVESQRFARGGGCANGFVEHTLEHVTEPDSSPAPLFDSNGSGVAAADLDDDGFVDIVLGNLAGPSSILWNEGDWQFQREPLGFGNVREVNTIDVDADGLLDITFGTRAAGVAVWRNRGDRTFEPFRLKGVLAKAYSIAWSDTDHDNDLDLIVASYDSELDQRLKSTFLFSDGAGVMAYTNQGDAGFVGQRLAEGSQALATNLVDFDLDGRDDIIIGNDFDMRDMAWRNTPDGWEAAEPFEHTSAHTMSFDAGDVNNDGLEEYFSTDMKPMTTDTKTLAAWMPLMATLPKIEKPGNPQRVANTLQARRSDATFAEIAERSEIDAAGWAWSGRFGDFDNDGHLDLYVVNGMIAASTFRYLPNGELVERNVMFVNRGDGVFKKADWGTDTSASGRGSVHADLDNDGRLDIVVNNLSSPSTVFENQLCDAGTGFDVAVRWPSSANTAAIGARITLTTTAGSQVRYVRSGGGYISGEADRVHFGVIAGVRPISLEVRWPDGATSMFTDLTTGHLHEVTRP